MSGKVRTIIDYLVFAAIIVVAVFLAYKPIMKQVYPVKYENYVEQYAEEYEVDETLVYALIKTESGFDENAVSDVGARGLCQIMPDTFQWLQNKTGETNTKDKLFEPEISIKYGTLFLSILYTQFESDQAVIAAYHAGAAQVQKWLDDEKYSKDGVTLTEIPASDTAHYVEKMTKAIEMYDKLYN